MDDIRWVSNGEERPSIRHGPALGPAAITSAMTMITVLKMRVINGFFRYMRSICLARSTWLIILFLFAVLTAETFGAVYRLPGSGEKHLKRKRSKCLVKA